MGVETAGQLTPHRETHARGSEPIEDVIIGMADKLTVPFALAVGRGL